MSGQVLPFKRTAKGKESNSPTQRRALRPSLPSGSAITTTKSFDVSLTFGDSTLTSESSYLVRSWITRLTGDYTVSSISYVLMITEPSLAGSRHGGPGKHMGF